MKTTKNNQLEGQPLLFKTGLKFMDFWHVTNNYLQTTSLNEKTKKEVMIRIHDFSFHLNTTIGLYPIGTKKVSQEIYDSMASGLKETARRAKISLALNKKFNKPFAAYWPYLAGVLKQDATLLKDEHLQKVMLDFEDNVSSIK